MDSTDSKLEDKSQICEEQRLNKVSIDPWRLVKKKLVKTDIVIKQHDDAMRECRRLQEDLSIAKSEKQDVLSKYNLAMEKVTKLELASLEHEQTIEKYKGMTEKQTIKLEENAQHMNQLNFKITEIEIENSLLKDEKKILETANKSPKKMIKEKKSVKHQGSQYKLLGVQSTTVNTDPINIVSTVKKCDQSTMTDIRRELLPIYCNKCSTEINPVPTHQILEVMTDLSYDRPLTQVSTNSLHYPREEPFEIMTNNSINIDEDNKSFSVPIIPANRDCIDVIPDNKVDELTKEVEKLGKLIKSVMDEKSNNSCHQHCCPNKNIKFMVQLPTEKRVLKSKREKRKLKKLKRLSHFKIKSVKKRKCLSNDNWQVEDYPENSSLQVNPGKKKKVLDSLRSKTLDSLDTAHVPGAYVRIPIVKDTNIITSESQVLEAPGETLSKRRIEKIDHDSNVKPIITDGTEKIEKINESFHPNESAEVPSYDVSNVDLTKSSCNKKKRCKSKTKSGFEINEIIKNDNLDLIEKCDELSVNVCNNIVSPDLSNSTTSQVPDSQNIPKRDLSKNEKVAVSDKNKDVLITETKFGHIQSALQKVEIIEKTEKYIESRNDLLNSPEQKVDRDALEDFILDEKGEDKVAFSIEVEKTSQQKDSNLTENIISTADFSSSLIPEAKVDEINSEEKNNEVKEEEQPAVNDSLDASISENSTIQNVNNDLDEEISVNNLEVRNDEKLENINTESTKVEKIDDVSESPASPGTEELEDEYSVGDMDKSLKEKSNKENRNEELTSSLVHKLPLSTTMIERRRSKRILPNQDLISNVGENDRTNYLQISEVKSSELPKRKRNVSRVSYSELSDEEGGIVDDEKPKRKYSFRSADTSKASSEEINTENSKSIETNEIDLTSQKPLTENNTESRISFKELFDDDDDDDDEEEEDIVENIKQKHRYSFRSTDTSKLPPEEIDSEILETDTIDLTSARIPLEEDDIEIAPVTKKKRILPSKNLFEPTEEKTEESMEDQKPSSDTEELCNDVIDELPVRKRRGRKPTNTRKNLLTKIRRLGKKTTRSSTLSFESKLSQNTDPTSFPVDSLSTVKQSKEPPKPADEDTNIIPTKKRIAHKPKPIDPNGQNDTSSQVTKVLKKTRSSTTSKDSSETDIISSLMDKFDETSKDRARVISSLRKSNPVPSPEPSLRMLNDIAANTSLNQENSNTGTSTPRSLLKPLPFDTSALSALLGKKSSFVGSNLGISPAFTASTLRNNSTPGTVSNLETPVNSFGNGLESDNSHLNSTVTRVDNLIQNNEYNISSSLLAKNARGGNLNSEEKIESNFEPDDKHENSTLSDLPQDRDDHLDEPSTSNCMTPVREVKRKSFRGKNKFVGYNGDNEKSPIKKLRSREVVVPEVAETFKNKKMRTNRWSLQVQEINETNSCLGNTAVITCLNQFLSNPESQNFHRNKVNVQEFKKNESFIQKQLQRLLDDEEWTKETNSEVTRALLDSQQINTIALVLIEFAAEVASEEEPLDRSYTPPAPLMTRPEQKFVALIECINKEHPEFFDLVIDGIQYKLFRLGKATHEVQIVESLFRMVVVLGKIKKDRERIRLFICDALYCLQFRAINILFIALTSWPEIIPHYDPNGSNDILIETVVFTIMTLHSNTPYNKLNALRKLLSSAYGYPNSGYILSNFRDKIIQNLKNMDNVPNICTAVLIFCKKQGPVWSKDHIIKPIKYMIVNKHPYPYELLVLLGNILRSFRESEASYIAVEVIDELCVVLGDKGKDGPDDLQEGIVSCLLSITKYKYLQVALTVLKWPFYKDLRATTKLKLNTLFKANNAKWWMKFIQDNFPPK